MVTFLEKLRLVLDKGITDFTASFLALIARISS